jgi:hypothetical protein
MKFPDFFDAAPRIRMRDPLAAFLGASEGGLLEYGYGDAVKLAGHSCPTVASAYLMTRAALASLYPGEVPERGAVRVEMHDRAEEGVAGVIANVVSLLTGAAQAGGFKGIAGRFVRRDLLAFGADFAGQVRFTREDTGASVAVSARLDRVPSDPRVGLLLPRLLGGAASAEEAALFRDLWQNRVRALLVEHADDPEVIVVQPANAPA